MPSSQKICGRAVCMRDKHSRPESSYTCFVKGCKEKLGHEKWECPDQDFSPHPVSRENHRRRGGAQADRPSPSAALDNSLYSVMGRGVTVEGGDEGIHVERRENGKKGNRSKGSVRASHSILSSPPHPYPHPSTQATRHSINNNKKNNDTRTAVGPPFASAHTPAGSASPSSPARRRPSAPIPCGSTGASAPPR